MLDTFEAARRAGPYDDYPVLPAGVDPQLHLSRNDRPQPFHLVCGKDCMIVQMAGKASVEFRDSTVLKFHLTPGDYVYVPAGTPHRIKPDGVAVQYRYKAEDSGLEAAAFYCEACGGPLHRSTWDNAEEIPQRAYLRVVQDFNASAESRTCGRCGQVHPPLDLTDYRWSAIAEELAEELEAD
jgi:3-hydroxyanthranilate 3,4-dioxygenase